MRKLLAWFKSAQKIKIDEYFIIEKEGKIGLLFTSKKGLKRAQKRLFSSSLKIIRFDFSANTF
jgi:hypothetical protein